MRIQADDRSHSRRSLIVSNRQRLGKVTLIPEWLRLLSAIVILLILLAPVRAAAEEITVAAASDLTFVFPEVGAKFQKEAGNSVKFSFGSSGNFLSQIQNGAPFDMFFSADIGYPKKLEAAGLVEPGTLYEYGVGKLVLWVPSASTLDLKPGLAVV